LRSTMSSARSRNLGRVAFMVRNRNVTPRNYRTTVFEKNTMIESTLNWLAHMNKSLINNAPTSDDVQQGNNVAGFVKILSRQRTAFPRPPKLKRHIPKRSRKPKFMTSGYGETPFGQHAIKRSGVSVVPKIGYAERMAMQTYLAHTRHRKYSEHVEYGGGFVMSWSEMTSGIIVALDITNGLANQESEHIRLGDFSSTGIAKLQRIATEMPSLPVLALHSYDGIRGLWHAIHKGQSYTVLADYDLEHHESDVIRHQIATGDWVLLALQGFMEDFEWSDTVPTSEEVRHYQNSSYGNPMPSIIHSVEDQNILDGAVQGATYATEINYKDAKVLVYIAPEVTSLPKDNPSLISRLPFLRAKVVASLSAGGYWHTAMRGVAFRAYLRGAFYQETLWTGGVIGWRQSTSTVPVYCASTGPAVGVRALVVLGGYNGVDQVSRFNPDMHSKGYKVVCESNTETYELAFHVGAQYRDAILNANYGKRYHTGNNHGSFLDLMQPDPPQPVKPCMPDKARADIIGMLMGTHEEDAW